MAKREVLTPSERMKFWKDEKIIGIDPGSSSGGIVVYSVTRKMIIETCYVSDLTHMDILQFLAFYRHKAQAFLEKVHGIPGQSGQGMFKFGQNFGHLQMALLALRIPTVEVDPQTWQKSYQIGVRGKKSKTEWKNKLKGLAQQLYPSVDVTAKLGDAILIMEYGRRKEAER